MNSSEYRLAGAVSAQLPGNSKILVFGGDQIEVIHSTYFKLDIHSGRIQHLDPPPISGRTNAAYDHYSSVDEYIYIIFGGYDGETYLNDTFVLDVREDPPEWHSVENKGMIPTGRSGHLIKFIPNRKEFIMHGGNNSRSVFSSVYRGRLYTEEGIYHCLWELVLDETICSGSFHTGLFISLSQLYIHFQNKRFIYDIDEKTMSALDVDIDSCHGSLLGCPIVNLRHLRVALQLTNSPDTLLVIDYNVNPPKLSAMNIYTYLHKYHNVNRSRAAVGLYDDHIYIFGGSEDGEPVGYTTTLKLLADMPSSYPPQIILYSSNATADPPDGRSNPTVGGIVLPALDVFNTSQLVVSAGVVFNTSQLALNSLFWRRLFFLDEIDRSEESTIISRPSHERYHIINNSKGVYTVTNVSHLILQSFARVIHGKQLDESLDSEELNELYQLSMTWGTIKIDDIISACKDPT